VPLLDILQSIPVLGFMPGVLLTLDAMFPDNNVGLELASIILIFTGQAWNMTFSYYHSLLSIPQEQREAASIFRFTWWQRLRWLELPFAAIGLVWNSMMSMAGGWFFLMISETYQLGEKDFRLPGLGSYMTVARDQGDAAAMCWAILAMILMIVALDQLLWRPVVVWAQKFRTEEGAASSDDSSWVLDLLRRSRLVRFVGHWWKKRGSRTASVTPTVDVAKPASVGGANDKVGGALSLVALLLLGGAMLWGMWMLVLLLSEVRFETWLEAWGSGGMTLGRVLLSTAIGTLWALPAGLAIGLSPKWSRRLQPIVQVAASFPAPMLFPVVIAILTYFHVPLDWGSIVLMLLGTQWYILFNVIAGAMAVPSDLREAATSFHVTGWQRFTVVYFPAVFPYLVTGWVTAAGGAWNTSIVAEFVTQKGETLHAWGLGDFISRAAEAGHHAQLAAGVLVMAIIVIVFNRIVWRPLYHLAQTRFSLSK
jgi:NitT/TauT family transport system permease protein